MKEATTALQQQYRDSSNFRKRSALVVKFSTNRYPWYHWVYEQFEPLSSASVVLELGCGPGSLWKRNLDRIPPGSTIVVSDFSFGMLRDSGHNLGVNRSRFSLCQLDAAALPFRNSSFETVVANMMFYHVENRLAALRDIRCVLRQGGRFYATTTGREYMRELNAAAMQILQIPRHTPSAERFGLENGLEQLRSVFSNVEIRRYQNELRVTEVQPLIDYFASMEPFISPPAEKWKALREYLQNIISERGEIAIPIDVGMLIAHD
ncbi:MAG TPA: class I SAM-dependent methyltransferase [Candidatus Binataceae bacterium]|nr:class I SAM-dependent methyltransferase [Candidatus Binataceae bacterium]